MKKNKHQCDLNTCSMCRSVLDDWKKAIDVSRKHLFFKKGEQFIKEGVTRR